MNAFPSHRPARVRTVHRRVESILAGVWFDPTELRQVAPEALRLQPSRTIGEPEYGVALGDPRPPA